MVEWSNIHVLVEEGGGGGGGVELELWLDYSFVIAGNANIHTLYCVLACADNYKGCSLCYNNVATTN